MPMLGFWISKTNLNASAIHQFCISQILAITLLFLLIILDITDG